MEEWKEKMLKRYKKTVKTWTASKQERERILISIKKANNLNIPVLFGYPDLFNNVIFMNDKYFEYCKIENVDMFIESAYHEFEIPKKRGGRRKILAPNKELLCIQRNIKTIILSKIKISKNAYGFRKRKDIRKNAYKHLNKEMVLNIDLKDFFESITSKRVYSLFHNTCGYNKVISIILTKLTTYKGILPQGAPTSPVISNIVSYMMDIRLNKLCEKFDVTYTRYADDMTFSGSKLIINNNFLIMIKRIIQEEGFEVNEKKTRFAGKGKRQEVTGLIVNGKRVRVDKEYLKKIRQDLYYIKKYGIENHIKKIGYTGDYKQYLIGRIMFVYQIDKIAGEKLIREYDYIFRNEEITEETLYTSMQIKKYYATSWVKADKLDIKLLKFMEDKVIDELEIELDFTILDKMCSNYEELMKLIRFVAGTIIVLKDDNEINVIRGELGIISQKYKFRTLSIIPIAKKIFTDARLEAMSIYEVFWETVREIKKNNIDIKDVVKIKVLKSGKAE